MTAVRQLQPESAADGPELEMLAGLLRSIAVASHNDGSYSPTMHEIRYLEAVADRLDADMGKATEAARLATEALEQRDRDLGEALEQLTAERTRRIDLEAEVEALDKLVAELLMDASQLSNRSRAAKRMVAAPLYPQPAGSGAGVR